MAKKTHALDPAILEEIKEIKTIKQIIEYGTKKSGDNLQYIFLDEEKNEHTRTFNQTWDESTAIGTYFYTKGMDGGKKIAIIAENSYNWITAYYGTIIGGNISVPMDMKLADDELISQLVRCGCEALVYNKKTAHLVPKVKEAEGIAVKEYFCIEEFDELKNIGREAIKNGDTRCIDAVVKPDDLACIVYTSGTTGLSKGVMLSHYNVASDVCACFQVNTGSHALGFLPLNHTFCWVSALFAGYIVGEWGYMCHDLTKLASDIKKYHPQNFSSVPLVVNTIYDRIWKTARKTGREDALKKGLKISNALMKLGIDKRRKIFKTVIDNLGGELEFIICGGANLDPKYEQGMTDLGIEILNGYGMTECSPTITFNTLDCKKLGSVGKPIPCCEVKINNPDENGVGEIYVKGSNVMQGYWNDPEATAAVFDGEWLKTGDHGYIDKDGFLFYVGRVKNLIILSNGKNVSPEEIEDKLICIDYVQEVLCYKENDKITAEFFLNEEDYPDARKMLKDDVAKINETLPQFKKVQKRKIRDEEFPKTTTLKIVRSGFGDKC